MTEFAIASEGLTKRYRQGFKTLTAVERLDLRVPMGATFGLLGPNGAGKTTTIQMLLGLVFPTAGRAQVLGGAIRDPGVRRRIGYVPEKFQLPSFLSAAEFLEIHGRLYGLSGATLKARISDNLAQVGLEARRGDRVGGFSKGMQQRLVLAQALLNDPALLILDEPTSALDPVGRREVREIIRAAHGRGATVLLNSHLLSEVEAVCDEVAVLRNGQLIKQGPIERLTAQTLHVEARIGGYGPAVEAVLAPLVGRIAAHGTSPDGAITQLSFDAPSEAELPAIARAILEAGGALYALTPRRDSLEDTFMRLLETP